MRDDDTFRRHVLNEGPERVHLSGARVDVTQSQQLLCHLQIIGALGSCECGQHHWCVACLVDVVGLAKTYSKHAYGESREKPVHVSVSELPCVLAPHLYPAAA